MSNNVVDASTTLDNATFVPLFSLHFLSFMSLGFCAVTGQLHDDVVVGFHSPPVSMVNARKQLHDIKIQDGREDIQDHCHRCWKWSGASTARHFGEIKWIAEMGKIMIVINTHIVIIIDTNFSPNRPVRAIHVPYNRNITVIPVNIKSNTGSICACCKRVP
jgi:hypothetical protein